MNREIQYSIIEKLRQTMNVESVEWERDDLDLTAAPKPMISVFNIHEESEIIAAGRRDYEDIYRYQITIRATSVDELEQLRQAFKNVMREKIELYDLSVQPFAVERFFVVDIDDQTVLLAEDGAREIDFHRVHIDVSVQTFSDIDSGSFTQ